MALSAAFLDGDHVEVIYPRHRELRAWPYWEVLELVRAEPAVMPDDAMAGRITQALGGHVGSTSIGPAGRAAALWTQDSYPPWYHVVIWSGSDPPDYRSLSARPSRQIRVVAARGLAVRIGSGWTNMPDRSPATAAHGVKLQPGGEDQRGPRLPSMARLMVQPPLTRADKIMLICLAGMRCAGRGKGRRFLHFGGGRGPAVSVL